MILEEPNRLSALLAEVVGVLSMWHQVFLSCYFIEIIKYSEVLGLILEEPNLMSDLLAEVVGVLSLWHLFSIVLGK